MKNLRKFYKKLTRKQIINMQNFAILICISWEKKTF